ncbi:hypothetical protein [Kitasatospora sp. MBT63]|nr:hypothetical protein [Kitasatospora sp. MBT63]
MHGSPDRLMHRSPPRWIYFPIHRRTFIHHQWKIQTPTLDISAPFTAYCRETFQQRRNKRDRCDIFAIVVCSASAWLKERPEVSALPPLTTNAVSTAARVSDTFAYKAKDLGVLAEPHFPSDVIALRVYRAVAELVWFEEGWTKESGKAPSTWQMAAIQAGRNAFSDPNTHPGTVLWVLRDRVFLAHTPAERAAFELKDLEGQSALRLPVGRWVAELPEELRLLRRRRPSRSRGSLASVRPPREPRGA